MRTPAHAILNRPHRGMRTPTLQLLVQFSSPTRRDHCYHRHLEPRYITYPPRCRADDLACEGMDQHVRLGKLCRNHSLNYLAKPSSDIFFIHRLPD
jgi:hypothetical protein